MWQAVTLSMTPFEVQKIRHVVEEAFKEFGVHKMKAGWTCQVTQCFIKLAPWELTMNTVGDPCVGRGAGPALQPWASRGNVCHGDAWQGAARPISDGNKNHPDRSSRLSVMVLVSPGAKSHFSCDGVRPLVATVPLKKPQDRGNRRIQILSKNPNKFLFGGGFSFQFVEEKSPKKSAGQATWSMTAPCVQPKWVSRSEIRGLVPSPFRKDPSRMSSLRWAVNRLLLEMKHLRKPVSKEVKKSITSKCCEKVVSWVFEESRDGIKNGKKWWQCERCNTDYDFEES